MIHCSRLNMRKRSMTMWDAFMWNARYALWKYRGGLNKWPTVDKPLILRRKK